MEAPLVKYLEINDQKGMMNAQGTADSEPCEAEVQQAINQRGYRAENISISHDGLQQTWRFTARLLAT